MKPLRGTGWLGWCSRRWCFVDADPDAGWALTWFSAATMHVTPEGSDVYSRRADVSKDEVRRIIASVDALVGRPTGGGWFMTHRAGQTGGGDAL